MGTFFPCKARCPHGGLKEGSQRDQTARWASTLSADRMRPARRRGCYQRAGLGVNVAPGASGAFPSMSFGFGGSQQHARDPKLFRACAQGKCVETRNAVARPTPAPLFWISPRLTGTCLGSKNAISAHLGRLLSAARDSSHPIQFVPNTQHLLPACIQRTSGIMEEASHARFRFPPPYP